MNTLPDEVKELVEAILIIGARRANDSLVHDSAKELIKQHIDRLSERVINLYAKAYAPVPGKEEMLREALVYLMQGVSQLPPLTAIEGVLIPHYEKAKAALEFSPSTASNEDKTNEVEIESASEALCLIVGKADRGFWGSEDLKQSMLHEILEVAKKGYILSQSNPEPKAVQQAAKEYVFKNNDFIGVPESKLFEAFLAGASFNKDAVEFAEWIDANGYECILHTDEHVKIWEGMKTEFKKIYTTEQLYKLYKTKE